MGIGAWELGLIFLIVMLLFGTRRLRTLGGDLGGAISDFRNAMREEGESMPIQGAKESQDS